MQIIICNFKVKHAQTFSDPRIFSNQQICASNLYIKKSAKHRIYISAGKHGHERMNHVYCNNLKTN